MQITIIDFAKRHGNGVIAYLGENQSNIQFMVLTQAHAKVAKKVIKASTYLKGYFCHEISW